MQILSPSPVLLSPTPWFAFISPGDRHFFHPRLTEKRRPTSLSVYLLYAEGQTDNTTLPAGLNCNG